MDTNKRKELLRAFKFTLFSISAGLILLCCLVIAVLAIFFNLKLFSERYYLKYTFSMISGFISVFFMYLGMDELLIISGTQRRVRRRKAEPQAEEES